MVKQRDNRATYRVKSRCNYLVTLTRLKNTYCGQPRYEASIIKTDVLGSYIGTFVYRFTGHYMSEIDEARFIVEYHENKDLQIRGIK